MANSGESSTIDIGALETVCLALGPYRNLTTLTASILFLHPNCQVLNHAGDRVLGNDKLNFLSDYSDEKFLAFIRFAIEESKNGRPGQYGGSITLSHAFGPQYPVQEIFQRSGLNPVKENIRSLFWKESQRVSNFIRTNDINLDGLLRANDKLRFLLPIRNPLDCAVSNFQTGHARLLQGMKGVTSVENILLFILDEFRWFETLRQSHPRHFFCFFDYEFGRSMLHEIAAFLSLAPDEDWCRNALAVFTNKRRYSHSKDLLRVYSEYVKNTFSEYPAFGDKLLRFVEG